MKTRPTSYHQGFAAGFDGQQLGINPYHPETETADYEQFVDGWCDGQNQLQQSRAVSRSV